MNQTVISLHAGLLKELWDTYWPRSQSAPASWSQPCSGPHRYKGQSRLPAWGWTRGPGCPGAHGPLWEASGPPFPTTPPAGGAREGAGRTPAPWSQPWTRETCCPSCPPVLHTHTQQRVCERDNTDLTLSAMTMHDLITGANTILVYLQLYVYVVKQTLNC